MQIITSCASWSIAVEEMHVVGGDGLEAEFRGELEQAGGDAALRFEAVVVDLDVGVFLAVDVHEFGERFAGLLLVAGAAATR